MDNAVGIPLLVVVAVFALVPLFFGAVIVVFALVMTTRSAPLPADPESTVTFHARVLRPGHPLALRSVDPKLYGFLTVTPSEIVWRSEAGDGWATPITSVLVTATKSAFAISGSGVLVEIDGSGPWRFVVSDKPINKVMRNTAKEFREADAARKLTGLLLARGARDGSARVA